MFLSAAKIDISTGSANGIFLIRRGKSLYVIAKSPRRHFKPCMILAHKFAKNQQSICVNRKNVVTSRPKYNRYT